MGIDLSFDEATFSGQVPLFPLPGSVLLPGGLLPLHVFEPRYRAMVADSLAGERLIGMSLLKPGYEEDYDGCPAIEDWTCVGRIVLEEQLPDGRYNMVLAGLRRAQILDEDRSRAYRVARVALPADVPLTSAEERSRAQWLSGYLQGLAPELLRDGSRPRVVRLLRDDVPERLPLGAALDLCADALLLGVQDRLALLRAIDVRERLDALTCMLRRRAGELEAIRRPFTWPPRFSQN